MSPLDIMKACLKEKCENTGLLSFSEIRARTGVLYARKSQSLSFGLPATCHFCCLLRSIENKTEKNKKTKQKRRAGMFILALVLSLIHSPGM